MSRFGVEFGSADADMEKEKTKTLAQPAFSASGRPQIGKSEARASARPQLSYPRSKEWDVQKHIPPRSGVERKIR